MYTRGVCSKSGFSSPAIDLYVQMDRSANLICLSGLAVLTISYIIYYQSRSPASSGPVRKEAVSAVSCAGPSGGWGGSDSGSGSGRGSVAGPPKCDSYAIRLAWRAAAQAAAGSSHGRFCEATQRVGGRGGGTAAAGVHHTSNITAAVISEHVVHLRSIDAHQTPSSAATSGLQVGHSHRREGGWGGGGAHDRKAAAGAGEAVG
jgi:hypothetical protein